MWGVQVEVVGARQEAVLEFWVLLVNLPTGGLLRKGWEGHLQDFLKHIRVKLGPVFCLYHQVRAADVLGRFKLVSLDKKHDYGTVFF